MPKRPSNLRESNDDDQQAEFKCDCGDFNVKAHRNEMEDLVMRHRRTTCKVGMFTLEAAAQFKEKLYASKKNVSYIFLLYYISHEHFFYVIEMERMHVHT